MRNSRLVLVAITALAAGAALTWHIRSGTETNHSANDTGAAVQLEAVRSPSSLTTPGTQAHPPAMKQQSPGSKSLDAHSPMLAYENSEDLAQVVEQLSPAAQSGDWQAKWMLARAFDECFPQVADPTLYGKIRASAHELPPEVQADMLRHLNRSEHRCRQLIASGQVTRTKVLESFDVALQTENLANRATSLVNSPESMSENDAKAMIRKIVESRDPWAIWALSEVMGETEDGANEYGPFSGSKVDRWAWKFVACALGYPCGPDSAEVRRLCVTQGHCASQALEGVVQQVFLTPAEFKEAIRKRDELLGIIAAGNVQSIFR